MDIELLRAQALKQLGILDTPPEERFERLTRLAMNVFDVPAAQVTLLDGQRQWFKSNPANPLTELPREITFCTHTVETDDGSMVVNDASADPRFAENPLIVDDPNVRFYAGVSICNLDGVPLGTFCILDVKSRVFTAKELQILKDIGALAEREVVNVQLAMFDELTGLSNRRGFLTECEVAVKHATRQQRSATFVYIDLDDFKAINDQHGHAAGDRVLVRLAEGLTKTFRQTDVIARYGGDEFVACCIDLPADEMQNLVERLRAVLAAQKDELDFDFSIGAVTKEREELDVSIADLLDAADQQMYQRKRAKKQ